MESEKRETIVKGSKEFEDSRGKISNFELPEMINWIGVITSKKGVLRANHYHPVQEQKVLVMKGSYVSVYKDLANGNNPLVDHVAKEGDLVITPPNVAHVMIFLEDSIILNLVNGEREHENFGKHTIPYVVVDPQDQELVSSYLSKYKGE